jgi:hypothetical protein
MSQEVMTIKLNTRSELSGYFPLTLFDDVGMLKITFKSLNGAWSNI